MQAAAEVRDSLVLRRLRGTVGFLIDGPLPPHGREDHVHARQLRALFDGAAGVVRLSGPAMHWSTVPHVETDLGDRRSRALAGSLGETLVLPWSAPANRSVVRAPSAMWIGGEPERLDRAIIDRAVRALRSCLGSLKLTDDRALTPGERLEPRRIETADAPTAGVIEPLVRPGAIVRAGQVVAQVGEPGLPTRRAVRVRSSGVVLGTRSGRSTAGPAVAVARVPRARLALLDAERLLAPTPAVVTTKSDRDPLRVGWCEWVGLPELGIDRIKAKIDTGARTSALHVNWIRPAGVTAQGEPLCDVEIPLSPDTGRLIVARVRVREYASVRDSGGHRERRPVIETTLRLGPLVEAVRVTLTDRGDMSFPMLVGRTALSGTVIDPTGRHLLSDRSRLD